MGRYTVHDDEAVDLRVQQDLDHIMEGVVERFGKSMRALVLAGGYGRGEGGVIIEGNRYLPLSDYDLCLVSRHKPLPVRLRLKGQAAEYTTELERALGIEVSLNVVDEKELRAAPPTLAFLELKVGHQVLWGDGSSLAHIPISDARALPLMEGTRLLFNRGAALLAAVRQLRTSPQLHGRDRWVVAAAGAKVQIALGDCLLLLQGRYHPSYQERARRLDALRLSEVPEWAYIRAHYPAAIQFKLRPDLAAYAPQDLAAWLDELRAVHERFYAWFEGCRLGRDFDGWEEYALLNLAADGCRPRPGGRAKDVAKHALHFRAPRPENLGSIKWYRYHPEARLRSALPFLLYRRDFQVTSGHLRSCSETTPETDPVTAYQVPSLARRLLNVGWDKGWEECAARFVELWHRVC